MALERMAAGRGWGPSRANAPFLTLNGPARNTSLRTSYMYLVANGTSLYFWKGDEKVMLAMVRKGEVCDLRGEVVRLSPAESVALPARSWTNLYQRIMPQLPEQNFQWALDSNYAGLLTVGWSNKYYNMIYHEATTYVLSECWGRMFQSPQKSAK